ncbi:MAG: hypothetical protein RQ750_07635, partial [Roseovarius sp.]|nr:hypothetical protein [Roseovarius sp.]
MSLFNAAAALSLGLLVPFAAMAEAPVTQSRSVLGEAIRATLIETPDLLTPLRERMNGLARPAPVN